MGREWGGLRSYLNTPNPYGDPEALLRGVEHLPLYATKRGELCFDDRWFALFSGSDILICPLDQILDCYGISIKASAKRIRERELVEVLPNEEKKFPSPVSRMDIRCTRNSGAAHPIWHTNTFLPGRSCNSPGKERCHLRENTRKNT